MRKPIFLMKAKKGWRPAWESAKSDLCLLFATEIVKHVYLHDFFFEILASLFNCQSKYI